MVARTRIGGQVVWRKLASASKPLDPTLRCAVHIHMILERMLVSGCSMRGAWKRHCMAYSREMKTSSHTYHFKAISLSVSGPVPL